MATLLVARYCKRAGCPKKPGPVYEKLRSGVNGRVREAILWSVARILVGADGTVTLETRPDGLLGMNAIQVRLGGEGEGGLIQQPFHSSSDRRWRVTMPPMFLYSTRGKESI